MKKYDGKTAWWLWLIFITYDLLPLFTLSSLRWNTFNIVILLIYYACNLIWIPILIRNKIELYNDYFIFYYGFQKETFKICNIKKIEKSRCSISSSANSLDRIYINTDQKDFYVSLKANDDFIEEINKRKS